MQPHRPMFQRLVFDPDTIHAMGEAFDDVCRTLAADRHDLASRLIARKIIELARAGERDRTRLCRETLTYFGLDQDGGQART
jgi:hypothetical protein